MNSDITDFKEEEPFQMWHILLVEDEEIFARAVVKSLERAGHYCKAVATLKEARIQLSNEVNDYNLVILDMRLPDGEGIELLADLIDKKDSTPSVVVVTAYGDVAQAVEAMKLGAADYLKKPIDLDELLITLEKVMESAQIKSRLNFSLAREINYEAKLELLGDSELIKEVRKKIRTIAEIGGEASPTVLIEGETGTGKDVSARLLHYLGPRANSPFVHIDCTALPKDIMEAELFGHVRGAFTSAHSSRAGLIEAAEGGTVFLDEIGELSLNLQAKLLNVLERRVLRKVGSAKEVPVRARFIAATNRDLSEGIKTGEFRDDLYYRLNVLTISMPSLREFKKDIPLIALELLKGAARVYGRKIPIISEDANLALMSYGWPGNVRELKNVIDRALLLTNGEIIESDSLQLSRSTTRGVKDDQNKDSIPFVADQTLAEVEGDLIKHSLKASRGNTSEAARKLGITRMKLRYRMEKYQIRSSDFAK